MFAVPAADWTCLFFHPLVCDSSLYVCSNFITCTEGTFECKADSDQSKITDSVLLNSTLIVALLMLLSHFKKVDFETKNTLQIRKWESRFN